MRDQLTAEHGVTVYDRDNEWFVGGGFSRGGGGEQGRKRPGGGRLADYSRQWNDDAPVDVEAVEALLGERSRMRERRMWDEADAVREQLQAAQRDVSAESPDVPGRDLGLNTVILLDAAGNSLADPVFRR